MSLEKLPDLYKKASDVYKKYQKILEVSDAQKGRITLVLKDNYKQSGRLKNLNYSVSFDIGEITALVSIFDDADDVIKYNISEIIDVF
jgi:hypothetical protein